MSKKRKKIIRIVSLILCIMMVLGVFSILMYTLSGLWLKWWINANTISEQVLYLAEWYLLMRKKIKGNCLLFLSGGIVYGLIEIVWRNYTHWSMILTGGLCFVSLYRIFCMTQKCCAFVKCLIGSAVITFIEFCSGCIFNLCMKMKVCDYSRLPMNLCGQICLLYSVLWGLLCIPIVYLCNMISRKWDL